MVDLVRPAKENPKRILAKSNYDFESPSGFDTVEVPLLRQHIGTKPGEEAQVCHDEDKNIFLGSVSYIRLLNITVDLPYN